MLDVQLVTLELEQRLNSLEENSNSSIGQLEVRVGILEATAVDHESRLAEVESDIEGSFFLTLNNLYLLVLNVNHFYHYFSVVERDILVADIFAFHAVLTWYDIIDVQTSIQFN